MKRIQQDHGSSASTGHPPRASLPSTTANSPTPRSRRASDYPPLSHQTQIMKAVRRSAALPSLSLSIAPSPTRAMTMRAEESVAEFSPAKEDHAKTVTFSEPEDEELSDDSSICQSPSWEQYSQKKKKKKPKKSTDEKSAKEKEETALRRRSNRLIKSVRTGSFTAKPLAPSDRSISAPELSTSAQSSKMISPALTGEAQVALGRYQTPKHGLSLTTENKPKNKGFLSGFRLQHGNVAAVQKIVEARKATEKTAETDADTTEQFRGIPYETIPIQQPNGIRPSVVQSISRSKKPPSIRSVISTSDHSLSSQEKRSSGARTSTSSGHVRSQSLLSSTLNKLRGPSYLYYQPSGEGSAGEPSKPSNSSHDIDNLQGSASDASNDLTGKALGDRSTGNAEYPQQPFNFAFPLQNKRENAEPGPDIAPRGRQPRSRKVEINSPPLEQEEAAASRPSTGRRVQIEFPHTLSRDAVMALVTAQEKQCQTARTSQHTRPYITSDGHMSDSTKGQPNGKVEAEGKRTLRGRKNDSYRSRDAQPVGSSTASEERLNKRADTASPDCNRNDTLGVVDRSSPEDDQMSVGTYASTIRPISQSHDGALAESRRQQNTSRTGSDETHVRVPTPKRLDVPPQLITKESVDDLISFERDVPETLQQPLQPHRELDYFTSFSDSYLPPVLDLQSPNDDKFSSQRFVFPGSDEDSRRGTPHGHLGNSQFRQVTVADEGEQKVSGARDSGRPSHEQRPKNSPAVSTQHSDSDVPAFERLGLSSKAAKILVGAETASTSTAHSQHTDPSRSTSERSSSSTCDDLPPSPSSATTPDSSRPQSRKGLTVSQTEPLQTVLLEALPSSEGEISHRTAQVPPSKQSGGTAAKKVKSNADGGDGGSWHEVVASRSTEQEATPTIARIKDLAATPPLVATPISVSFANVLTQDSEEEGDQGVGRHAPRPLPPRAQSAMDLHAVTKLAPQSARPQRLHLKSASGAMSSVSLPSSPPADVTEEVMPRKSALKMSRNNSANGSETSMAITTGAAYLQEARKAVPAAAASSSRALRPHFSQKNSSASIRSTGNRAEPLAKMLVECCSCHFFHDMPSRVYECMAKPDSVVEDKSLGISAAITTMVRCPWCAHGMTTQCCSGYAAVVYLKEKLHGK
ncbi:hypothetical protein F4802DRAFT_542021 [Xylaria palmicola]|nr:hypothetical protein F4802DRAFT_542021 [Xylaria palmicola]